MYGKNSIRRKIYVTLIFLFHLVLLHNRIVMVAFNVSRDTVTDQSQANNPGQTERDHVIHDALIAALIYNKVLLSLLHTAKSRAR